MREDYGILMPAYRPEPVMVEYLKKLRDQWDGLILLIDDGSGPDYREQFQAAERLGVVVCRQEKNRGKGAAIKLGLTWCQEHRPELSGVVTVDCDGQHSLEDVEKVLAAMDRNPGSLILGCRSFGEGTPVRSQIGNRMTSAAMRIFYGISLEDTQTGLRGLPASWFPGLLSLSGERYEYELNMLIAARREGIPMATVPIRTVYFNENEGSHYRTVRDSLRIMQAICRGLIQYGLSSALSALVDVSIYAVLVKFVFVGALLSELSCQSAYSLPQSLPGFSPRWSITTATGSFPMCRTGDYSPHLCATILYGPFSSFLPLAWYGWSAGIWGLMN